MKIFNTNLAIESKAGESVEIPINNKVTILTGDSATGKTKLIRFLKLLLSDSAEIKQTSIDNVCDKVIVCESKEDVLRLIDKKVYKNGFNCVIILRKSALDATFEKLEYSLINVLKNKNLIKEN